MNEFKITEIISGNIVRVSPQWQLALKDGTVFKGDRIKIRGLDESKLNQTSFSRLHSLLIGTNKDLNLTSPEPVEYIDHNNALVSCSIFLSNVNIVNYFPEFVIKY